MSDLDIFRDDFVANIQTFSRLSYSTWRTQNPNEAAKWDAYRDGILAGGNPPAPMMVTKFGKALVAAGELTVAAPPPPPPPGSLFASLTGSDSNPGTEGAPFRTIGKLYASASGKTGVLRGGVWGTPASWYDLNTSAVTLTNYPGEKVTICGGGNFGGPGAVFRNLYFDGSNAFLNGPCAPPAYALGWAIFGNDALVEYCDFTQSGLKGSGILWGNHSADTGHRGIIRFNRIHGIGSCKAQDHGVYLGYGQDVQIYGNWLWGDTHGFGVQLYPRAVRAKVYSNVLDGFIAAFVIDDHDVDPGERGTHDCDLFNNVGVNMIVNPWASPSGCFIGGEGCTDPANGNKVRDSLEWNNPNGVGVSPNIHPTGMVHADPLFVDAANHDYRLKPGSPCAGYGLPTTIPGPTV